MILTQGNKGGVMPRLVHVGWSVIFRRPGDPTTASYSVGYDRKHAIEKFNQFRKSIGLSTFDSKDFVTVPLYALADENGRPITTLVKEKE
jgi:hypothetical protein